MLSIRNEHRGLLQACSHECASHRSSSHGVHGPSSVLLQPGHGLSETPATTRRSRHAAFELESYRGHGRPSRGGDPPRLGARPSSPVSRCTHTVPTDRHHLKPGREVQVRGGRRQVHTRRDLAHESQDQRPVLVSGCGGTGRWAGRTRHPRRPGVQAGGRGRPRGGTRVLPKKERGLVLTKEQPGECPRRARRALGLARSVVHGWR